MQARREGAERLIEIKRLADAKSQLNQKLAGMQGAWTRRFEVDYVPFVVSLCICEYMALNTAWLICKQPEQRAYFIRT